LCAINLPVDDTMIYSNMQLLPHSHLLWLAGPITRITSVPLQT